MTEWNLVVSHSVTPFNRSQSRVAGQFSFRVERAIEYKQFGLVDIYARYRGQRSADECLNHL